MDGDLYSDMAFFRALPGANWNEGIFAFKNSTPIQPNSCTGATFGYGVLGKAIGRPRLRVFAVSDVTGDGKQDILAVDPDTMSVQVLKSESNFMPSTIHHFANHRAILL